MARNAGRIGKVRMKATGFEFRVIEGPAEPENDMGATMMRHAREIGQWPGMTGSIVIGVFSDGTASVGIRWDDDCAVPKALVPSWIAEIVRRDLVTAAEAEGVFHQNFQWVE
jgi:hypothetical protein